MYVCGMHGSLESDPGDNQSISTSTKYSSVQGCQSVNCSCHKLRSHGHFNPVLGRPVYYNPPQKACVNG